MTNKNFNNEKISDNGFDYVDLGLPSGTLWATCNVGAKKPSDFGLYFQWGDTNGYAKEQVGQEKQFNWNSYKWNPNGDGKTSTKYTTTGVSLELEDDAANANMGGDWHIPTPAQIQELLDNTTSFWTTLDGVTGIKFTSKNGKFIFIPAAGYAWDGSAFTILTEGSIWSSMLSTYGVNYGQVLNFYSGCDGQGDAYQGDAYRFYGFPVRGVIDRSNDNSKDNNNKKNEELNLVEILKNAPKGTKLWSPIIGECELFNIDFTCKAFPIVCIGVDDGIEWNFKADGTYTENAGVECVLFPSKENRNWSAFNVQKTHKHFEPFQKVLIRTWTEDGYILVAAEYSNYDALHSNHYLVSGLIAKEEDIIPYKGNENKLGKPANN